MVRRLLGAILCLLLIGSAAGDVYAAAARKDVSLILQFEPSYVSPDPVEDTGDTAHPYQTLSWSAREKIITKLILGPFVRKVRFTAPTMLPCERLARSRLTYHDILRYQEVCRI